MIGIGIRELQDALHGKADEIQREFVEISDALDQIGRKLLEARGEDIVALRESQNDLREQQRLLAGQVNAWRERARDVLHQRTQEALSVFIEELLAEADEPLKEKLLHAQSLIQTSDADREQITREAYGSDETPASRLINRARTSFDLRGSDPAERQREAITFSNRPGISLDDQVLKEIEEAVNDPDPLVRETMTLTLIQMLRFRALRAADLDLSHKSVKDLCKIQHEAVVPVLIEILENPRRGFVKGQEQAEDADNSRSRMLALLRLVEWHTHEARTSLRMRQFDQNPEIVRAAERALELFPGDWKGPLKKRPNAPAGS